ncbi:MAG: thioredoxin family protein [Ignavibacteriales bacterium]
MHRVIRPIALTIAATLVLSLTGACAAGRSRNNPPADSQQPAQQPANDAGAHIGDADKSHIDDAAKKGLPAVIKLGSDTCDPCRRMKPVMEELAAHYGGKIVFLTVDVYDHPDLASKYQVQVIPKIIFVDRTGKPVAYVEGYQTTGQMKSFVEKSGILE